MLTIKSTGSIRDVVESMRAVHGRLVPYAAATALTQTARTAAKVDIPAAMRQAFNNPRPYTLNSLFVQPARRENLSARVAVKNTAAGTRPEHFLFPEVEGGPRNTKRFETALRKAGAMRAGERAMPATDLPESQFESGAFIRALLSRVESGKGAGKGARVFVGAVGRSRTRGVWQASGSGKARTVKPLFIFTSSQPQYRQRLDFEGVAQKAAERDFPVQFDKALAALIAKGWRA